MRFEKLLLLIVFFCSVFLFPSFSFSEDPTNYCKDTKSWVEWDDLVQKYPNDKDVQALHALRIGLCAKIEQGSITFDMANEIFNKAYEIVYRNAKSERERLKQKL